MGDRRRFFLRHRKDRVAGIGRDFRERFDGRGAVPVLQPSHVTSELLLDPFSGLIESGMRVGGLAGSFQDHALHDMGDDVAGKGVVVRSEEHTSELQSLMRIPYAVLCLKKKNNT